MIDELALSLNPFVDRLVKKDTHCLVFILIKQIFFYNTKKPKNIQAKKHLILGAFLQLKTVSMKTVGLIVLNSFLQHLCKLYLNYSYMTGYFTLPVTGIQ